VVRSNQVTDAMRTIQKQFRRIFSGNRPNAGEPGPVRLTPDAPTTGRVLMSYSTRVYHDLLAGKGFDRTHISAWQNLQIARIFLDLGFEIEVFHFEDENYLPKGSFDVVVDIVSNLGRLGDALDPGTIKILYPMFAHWTIHNLNSYARHRALAERRGVAIPPKRLLSPNSSVECADFIFCKGGQFGRSTYNYSDNSLIPVAQIHPHAINEFIDRDFGDCGRNFIWIGGSSAVHKGLDLVLEAFASLPDLNITVLGRVAEERRFAEVYRKELFELPNVRIAGWVDTLSDDFRSIVSNASGIVAPSATELSCGSVIAGMMNGLIPITTVTTDIDVAGIGRSIEDGTVQAVHDAVVEVADMSPASLRDLSHAARDASQELYGGEKFIRTFRIAVCNALDLSPPDHWETDEGELRIPNIKTV
jgi:glycosyltransferase involved in cell wall biosynthesis